MEDTLVKLSLESKLLSYRDNVFTGKCVIYGTLINPSLKSKLSVVLWSNLLAKAFIDKADISGTLLESWQSKILRHLDNIS